VPTSQTVRSTPRLSEVARHVVFPDGIVTTAWPRVVAKCAELGVSFDEWQHGVGSIALGKRADGKYAATVGGIVLSIPRQVGKTFLVGMIVIALCLLHPGLTVLWSAHRTRTATKTFQTLKGMTSRSKIKPLMLDPRNANGEQEVRFRNGSVIMFGAREQGFGRGFDEVDIEVFDEAQILTEKALEDMVPAANQSRQPSGALLFFMGTPPRPGDPGEEFTNRRAAALAGTSEDMVYVEFSADKDARPDDRAQWAKANPSFPSHTPIESMKRMRANLTDDASFMREALGVWDDEGGNLPFPLTKWAALADVDGAAFELRNIVYAIDTDPDREWSAIVSCGSRPDGSPQVEIVDHRPGTEWVVDRLRAVNERRPALSLVYDRASQAASLATDLATLGVRVEVTNSREMANACGEMYDAIVEGGVRHVPHPSFDSALAGAKKRNLGDAWALDRRKADSDITPLVAAVLAHWCAGKAIDVSLSVW
jgi:hypothetical protein